MGIFHAFDNVFGGQNFEIDHESYQTKENIFQGKDVFENGKLVASTKPNIFGGVDMHNTQNELILSTKETVFGGQDIVDGQGRYEGTITQNEVGMNYQDHANAFSTITVENGNVSTILNYQDPLAHIGNYVLPTLIL